MRIKKFYYLTLPLLCLFIILLSSCATTGFYYPPGANPNLTQVAIAPLLNKNVIVRPFLDNRGEEENTDLYSLYWVPIMPYGYADYNYPERARYFTTNTGFEMDPVNDLARATAYSFNTSNLFNSVRVSYNPEDVKTDYYLEGRINTLSYSGRIFSYGLPCFSSIFWVFGAPFGTSTNHIDINLFLKDSKGNILWQYKINKEDYETQWLYSSTDDFDMYPIMLEKGYNAAVMNLYHFILDNPAKFGLPSK